jgi:TRAP-type C4-dicarboxylate transport system substrate-binding protein
MACSAGSYHISILPEVLFEWGLPYGAKTPDVAGKLLMNEEYLKVLRKAYAEKHNVHLLGLSSVSSYNYVTRFPVNTMEDLKGKKIRALGVTAQLVKAQGGTPSMITGAEQYMALQRGTIDGTVYPPYAGITYKIFEVAKFHSWPPIYSAVTVNHVVNLGAWNKLPKEYQEILQDEVTKMAKYSFEVSGPALEKIATEEGKKMKAEATFLSDGEYQKFRQAALPLWEEWGKSPRGRCCRQGDLGWKYESTEPDRGLRQINFLRGACRSDVPRREIDGLLRGITRSFLER